MVAWIRLFWMATAFFLVSGSDVNPRSVQHLLLGRCTEPTSERFTQLERQFAHDKMLWGHQLLTLAKKRQLSPTAKPTSLFVHVISADGTPEKGNVRDAQIMQQVDALNSGFADTGLSFQLINVSRIVNADWFNNAGPDTAQQDAMKTSLRRGGHSDLNIYTVGFTSFTGLLGYATFPQSYQDSPVDDEVVLSFSSLPGGSLQGYNQGKTGVHETGHWFGLYHTFQGGCLEPGDMVSDTPPEGIPSQDCMPDRKTCAPDAIEDLSDPINNYMDYSPDSCMTEFSPDQAERARIQGQFYRGIY
ncbi:metalloprotease [Coprinopsis marcescibilis]|uniref:Metalloprotease n=1 Tax=Coprinopsis marcescibilis TaxID=230819 RepID=A0A5C3KL10_COPMA|nr:metalloprotease [Coprinopsis marcescibilis]